MKQQLSVCDTIIQIRQDSTPYVFLQLNALGHNAKRPDKITCEVRVFTLTFPDSVQGIDTEHYIYRSNWKRWKDLAIAREEKLNIIYPIPTT